MTDERETHEGVGRRALLEEARKRGASVDEKGRPLKPGERSERGPPENKSGN
jgi:hypothetical protein